MNGQTDNGQGDSLASLSGGELAMLVLDETPEAVREAMRRAAKEDPERVRRLERFKLAKQRWEDGTATDEDRALLLERAEMFRRYFLIMEMRKAHAKLREDGTLREPPTERQVEQAIAEVTERAGYDVDAFSTATAAALRRIARRPTPSVCRWPRRRVSSKPRTRRRRVCRNPARAGPGSDSELPAERGVGAARRSMPSPTHVGQFVVVPNRKETP